METTSDVKQLLKNIINDINDEEKVVILRQYKDIITHVRNKNGYFFNLSLVDQKVLNDMYNSIILIKKNRDTIKNINEDRENSINNYKNVIEENLQAKNEKIKNEYIEMLKIKEKDIFNIKKIPLFKSLIKENSDYQFKTTNVPNKLIKQMKTKRKLQEQNEYKKQNDSNNMNSYYEEEEESNNSEEEYDASQVDQTEVDVDQKTTDINEKSLKKNITIDINCVLEYENYIT